MKDSLKYLPLALLLFISIIACVVAQTDGVIDNQTDSNQKILNEYNMSDVGEELVYMRGENVESFKADSGKVLSKIYTEPIFYQTDADTMARIDTSIKPIDELEREILYSAGWAAYDSIVDAGPYKFYWDADGANSCFMRDGKYLLYEMVSEKSGVITTYSPTTSGIKELIKVSNDTLKTITWNVAGNIATIYNYGDGQYDLQDGGFLFRINKPVAWDDSGKAVEINALYTNGTLSYTWDNSDIVYPVWVDPTSTITTNGFSLKIFGYDSSDNYANARNGVAKSTGNTNIVIGQSYGGSTYQVFRTFLGFPLTTVPAASTVDACSLYIYATAMGGSAHYIRIRGAKNSKSVFDANDFNRFDGWAASGAYGGTELGDSYFEFTGAMSANAWYSDIFSTAGKDSVKIALSDTLWIAMISSKDISGTAPSIIEYTVFSVAADKLPYLSLSYSIPSYGQPFGPFKPINNGVIAPFINNGSILPDNNGN